MSYGLILLVNQVEINPVKTHIALKVARFSSKKVSSSVKNLKTRKVQTVERTFKKQSTLKESINVLQKMETTLSNSL